MKYDKIISFYSSSEERYNPETGEYDSYDSTSTDLIGNVTDMGTNEMKQIFGFYDQNIKIIRFRSNVPENWKYLTINNSDNHYVLKTKRKSLKGSSLIVGETNE